MRIRSRRDNKAKVTDLHISLSLDFRQRRWRAQVKYKAAINRFLFFIYYFHTAKHPSHCPAASSNHISKLSIVIVQTAVIACCQTQPFFQSMPYAETSPMAPRTPLTGLFAPKVVSP